MKTLAKTLTAISLSGALLGANQSLANDWKDQSHDAWLDGKAETVLLMNTSLNSFDINTDVNQGTVILSGKVASEIDKELAEELVEGIDGVKMVENELSVINDKSNSDNSLVGSMTDAKVTTVLKSRYMFESEVSAVDINIDTKDGVVTLNGQVASAAESDLAEAIARKTDDVKRVVNNLEVAQS